MLRHHAAVLHDVDAGARKLRGRAVMTDAELKPHRARTPREREDLVRVTGQVFRSPENVDHVHRLLHIGQRSDDGFAEDCLADERSAGSRLDDILLSETRTAVATHDLVEIIRVTKGRKPVRDEELEKSGTVLPSALPDIEFGHRLLYFRGRQLRVEPFAQFVRRDAMKLVTALDGNHFKLRPRAQQREIAE